MLHGNKKHLAYYNILSVIYMINLTPASVKKPVQIVRFSFFFNDKTAPIGPGFTITLRHTTLDRTPLHE
jgi:hypothetical protein